MEPKLIYLATRHPSLTRSDFTARWRGHGRLGMSMPRWKNIRRYVHCDVQETGVEGISGDFDGVGLIWHRSPEARLLHRTDNSSQGQMEADEAVTFAEPVKRFCLLAEEHEIREGPAGPVKLIRFVERRADLSKSEFLDRWRTEFTRHLIEQGSADTAEFRCVQNYALPPEQGTAWGLPSDCVDEFWFDSVQSAVTAFEGFAAVRELERMLTSRITCVLTNEVVLHDQP
jgi:hypothetical protein